MIFKYIYRPALIILVCIISGCIGINRDWEEIESDYDHVLNVFSILNLDSEFSSFVGLYRTTDLNEVSQTFSRVDTLYYCDCDNDDDERCWCEDYSGYWVVDSIYEPAAIIKNASVNITDDNGNNFEFNFIENIIMVDTIIIDTTVEFDGYIVELDTTIFDSNSVRLNFYVDTSGTFNPQPGRQYDLSIIAPGYDPITGSLTTPPRPKFNSVYQRGEITDTIIVNEPFEISYDREETGKALVTGDVLLDDLWYDNTSSGWCGGYFDPFMVDLDDGDQYKQTVNPWMCFDDDNEAMVKDYVLRLTAMDENYYEYFVIGEVGEYSNGLLNYPTTKGRSVGIEGGFGIFGSIGSDWKMLKIAKK